MAVRMWVWAELAVVYMCVSVYKAVLRYQRFQLHWWPWSEAPLRQLQRVCVHLSVCVRLCLFFQNWHDELWKTGNLLCCTIITQHLYGYMRGVLLEVRVWREGSVFWETFLTDIRGIVWRGVLGTPAFQEGLFLWEKATRVEEGKGGENCTCSEKGRRSAINQKSKQRPRHWIPWA